MTKLAVGIVVLWTCAATAAWAAVLCEKKSGAVFIRDACKKKETAVDLATFGAVGPKGDKGDPGAPGAPGTARAYAYVDRFNPTMLAPSTTKGFTALTNPATGIWCLTPPAGVDPTADPPVMTVEYFRTASLNPVVQWVSSGSPCPAGTYAVFTSSYPTVSGNLQSATADNAVSFTIVVP